MDNLAEIIGACAKNNGTCQKLVYERFYGYALKIVIGYVHRYDAAVDVMNDGFVKVFRHIDRFVCIDPDETEKRFKGWIKSILINGAIDHLRKRNPDDLVVPFSPDQWEDYDHSPLPDERLIVKDIHLMVSKLPPASQAVFKLVVMAGMTHKEVSVILGISESTSKSNLARARLRLQKHLMADRKFSY